MMIAAGTTIGLLAPIDRPVVPPAKAATEAAPAQAPADVRRETVIRRDGNGHFFTYAEIDGGSVRFLVDTGADTVALTVEDAKRVGVNFNPARFKVVGKGVAGLVRGQRVILDSLVLDGKRVRDVHAVVLEGADVSLLGQSFLTRMGTLELNGDVMRLR